MSARLPRLPKLLLLAIIAGSALLPMTSGCRLGQTASRSEIGTADVKLGNQIFRLWIAATEADRQHGLMQRASMPPDRGMIFVFPHEQVQVFYMKNTLIPLDVIFLNQAGTVVSIKQMKALDRDASGEWVTTSSDHEALYAIELNWGAGAAAGIHVGEVVPLPPEIRSPANLD